MFIENITLTDIIVVGILLFIIYFALTGYFLAKKIKNMPIEDVHIGDSKHGGVLETRGMVWRKDGKGVIADSRPSSTYKESLIR